MTLQWPGLPPETLVAHRGRAARDWSLGEGVVLVPSGLPVPIAGTDQFYDFVTHPEHLYLAGIDLPGQVLAFDPAEGWSLFVWVPDEDERLWEGDTATPEEIGRRSGIDRVVPRDSFEDWLAARDGVPVALLGNADLVDRPAGYGLPALRAAVDSGLSEELRTAVTAARREKGPEEVALLRRAAEIAAEGHVAGIRLARAGMSERELATEIEAEFRRRGGRRPAYATIVGAGENAGVLHYAPGDRAFAEGEMVLVDAGVEYGGYMSDITRTFPVDARFSPEQRELYDLLLRAQEGAIARVGPGVEYRELHLSVCREIAEGLVELSILVGDPDALVERDAHALFLPHGLGHMIGLSTHDVGGYGEDRERSDRLGLKFLRTDLPLAAGNVVTIEPGIYFIRNLLTSESMRAKYADAVNWDRVDDMLSFGGLRIEDDVLVTEDGAEVLTAGVPKAPEEIEALRAD